LIRSRVLLLWQPRPVLQPFRDTGFRHGRRLPWWLPHSGLSSQQARQLFWHPQCFNRKGLLLWIQNRVRMPLLV
jgi:hypothetical protein